MTNSSLEKMCIRDRLKGVNAVQTFGRLNRICPPYDKKTFILDFVNKYEDIQKSFAPFYTTTLLSGDLNPNRIYDLEAQIDAFGVLDPCLLYTSNGKSTKIYCLLQRQRC